MKVYSVQTYKDCSSSNNSPSKVHVYYFAFAVHILSNILVARVVAAGWVVAGVVWYTIETTGLVQNRTCKILELK